MKNKKAETARKLRQESEERILAKRGCVIPMWKAGQVVAWLKTTS